MATLLQQLKADYEILIDKYGKNNDSSFSTAKLILTNSYRMIETQCEMEKKRVEIKAQSEARKEKNKIDAVTEKAVTEKKA